MIPSGPAAVRTQPRLRSDPSWVVEVLIYIGLCCAFVDELVRKAIPETPVIVTAVKDAFIMSAGALCVFSSTGKVRSYLKYFLPWAGFTLVSSAVVFVKYESVLHFLACIRTYCCGALLFFAGYYVGWQRRTFWVVYCLVIIGALVALSAASLQQYGPEGQLGVLGKKNYYAKHALAGGEYSESVFGSPQTLAHLALFLSPWVLANLLTTSSLRAYCLNFALFLGLCYAIYLTHMRWSIAAMILSIALIHILLQRSGRHRAVQGFWLRGLMIPISVGIALLVAVVGGYLARYLSDSSVDVSREGSFYSQLVDHDEIENRLLYASKETEELRDHNWLVGNGAGLAGSVSKFLENPPLRVPVVYDTGLFLILNEFGLVGLVTFGFCYLWPLGDALLRFWKYPRVSLIVLPGLVFSIVASLWFLLKAHTTISNGLSHLLWLGSLGLCSAGLDRSEADRRRAAREPLRSPMRSEGAERQQTVGSNLARRVD